MSLVRIMMCNHVTGKGGLSLSENNLIGVFTSVPEKPCDCASCVCYIPSMCNEREWIKPCEVVIVSLKMDDLHVIRSIRRNLEMDVGLVFPIPALLPTLPWH